jgi:hypothetical protein
MTFISFPEEAMVSFLKRIKRLVFEMEKSHGSYEAGTYLVTVLSPSFEKLPIVQLLKNFPAF